MEMGTSVMIIKSEILFFKIFNMAPKASNSLKQKVAHQKKFYPATALNITFIYNNIKLKTQALIQNDILKNVKTAEQIIFYFRWINISLKIIHFFV